MTQDEISALRALAARALDSSDPEENEWYTPDEAHYIEGEADREFVAAMTPAVALALLSAAEDAVAPDEEK